MQLTRVHTTNPGTKSPEILPGCLHHSPSQEPQVASTAPHQQVVTHCGRGRVRSGPAQLGAVPRETPSRAPSEGMDISVTATLRPAPQHGRKGCTCQDGRRVSSVWDAPAQAVSQSCLHSSCSRLLNETIS